jgi:hypothetical protein
MNVNLVPKLKVNFNHTSMVGFIFFINFVLYFIISLSSFSILETNFDLGFTLYPHPLSLHFIHIIVLFIKCTTKQNSNMLMAYLTF